MNDNFITKIFVKHVRGIKALQIPLSDTHRQHLIITGKNGSGKTSLLLELKQFLTASFKYPFARMEEIYLEVERGEFSFNLYSVDDGSSTVQKGSQLRESEKQLWKQRLMAPLISFGDVRVEFSDHERLSHNDFLFVFFGAKRSSSIDIPQGISAIEYKERRVIEPVEPSQWQRELMENGEWATVEPIKKDRLSHLFLQYLVNLKAARSFARDDEKMDKVKKIDNWFTNFENRLKDVFEDDSLQLKFDSENYNFDILLEGHDPFGFDRLSDGYASILEIVSELLLQSEALSVQAYELEGVVLIDEIETHLHVSLQKKILGFLVDFFPKIQFIVTTHSPFVISSIPNATICDLDSRECIQDLSVYSYGALIESFFNSDEYSDTVKRKIKVFEELALLSKRSPEQDEELLHLQDYFRHAPKYLSEELHLKLQQIELKKLEI